MNEKRLFALHDKLARLRFLDPACGCGNFLIVAYRELRVLELEILKMLSPAQKVWDIGLKLKVSVTQFAGMEIEDFSCQIARVGIWLTDHLMNLKAAEEFGQSGLRPLPAHLVFPARAAPYCRASRSMVFCGDAARRAGETRTCHSHTRRYPT